jgi:hypothetical protein
MATAHRTSGRRGQKLNAHYISALQCKLLTPDKEKDGHVQCHIFCFSLLSFPLYLFTIIVTQDLPLKTIKGEAWVTFGTPQWNRNSLSRYSSSHTTKETWDMFPPSKACNPYYEHSGARQPEQQRHPLNIGTFLPEPV